MPEPPNPLRPAGPTPANPASAAPQPAPQADACGDAMPCDRCGTAMFRMHAVWRCPACGYKTDCCGW